MIVAFNNYKYVNSDIEILESAFYPVWFDYAAILGPPLIGAAAAIIPESGPAGLLFGRFRYRDGEHSLLNSGNFRVGWSWNSDGWAGSRNYFGLHGGKPGTPDHWHQTYIPGPKGP